MANLNVNGTNIDLNWEKMKNDAKNDPQITKNSSKVKMLVNLENPSLFWANYVQVIKAQLPSSHIYLPYLTGQAKEKPKQHELILTSIEKIVTEIIRPQLVFGLLSDAIYSSNSMKLGIMYHGAHAYLFTLLGNEPEELDISNCQGEHFARDFKLYVESCLAELAKTFGCRYISSIESKKVCLYPLEIPKQHTIQTIQFVWEQSFMQHSCHVVPADIVEDKNSSTALYELYRAPDQPYCDFTILFADGQLKVHASQLYTRGGEALQKTMASTLKERSDKSLDLSCFSASTVKAFIEYIYLGPEAFCEQILAIEDKDAVDVMELFQLAQLYQIKNLINCCSNLMAVLSTPQDIPKIAELREAYKKLDGNYDERLNTLLENLFIIEMVKGPPVAAKNQV